MSNQLGSPSPQDPDIVSVSGVHESDEHVGATFSRQHQGWARPKLKQISLVEETRGDAGEIHGCQSNQLGDCEGQAEARSSSTAKYGAPPLMDRPPCLRGIFRSAQQRISVGGFLVAVLSSVVPCGQSNQLGRCGEREIVCGACPGSLTSRFRAGVGAIRLRLSDRPGLRFAMQPACHISSSHRLRYFSPFQPSSIWKSGPPTHNLNPQVQVEGSTCSTLKYRLRVYVWQPSSTG